MKHLFYSIALITLLVSCSDNKYEKLMTDYIEIHEGTRLNLNVKYSKFELSDITVQDSINLLNEAYEKEQIKRTKNVESFMQIELDYIESAKKQTYFDPNSSSFRKSQERLKRHEQTLENIKQWRADYLNTYDSRNAKDILAKKAEVKFSYDHPLLKTRAGESGIAIMNLNATKVIKYTQNK